MNFIIVIIITNAAVGVMPDIVPEMDETNICSVHGHPAFMRQCLEKSCRSLACFDL